jgi:hypothetical protein
MECWKAFGNGNMCGAAKWVIVSKNDVSQDDSKLVFSDNWHSFV